MSVRGQFGYTNLMPASGSYSLIINCKSPPVTSLRRILLFNKSTEAGSGPYVVVELQNNTVKIQTQTLSGTITTAAYILSHRSNYLVFDFDGTNLRFWNPEIGTSDSVVFNFRFDSEPGDNYTWLYWGPDITGSIASNVLMDIFYLVVYDGLMDAETVKTLAAGLHPLYIAHKVPDILFFREYPHSDNTDYITSIGEATLLGTTDGSLTVNASDTPVPIADFSTSFKQITVSQALIITDLEVSLDITHTYDADLTLELVSPDGTRVRLATQVGGPGNDYIGTIFDDSAATIVNDNFAPFSGTFRPEQPLSVLNGTYTNGAWRLEVSDGFSADVGTIDSFGLTFHYHDPSILSGSLSYGTNQYGSPIVVNNQDTGIRLNVGHSLRFVQSITDLLNSTITISHSIVITHNVFVPVDIIYAWTDTLDINEDYDLVNKYLHIYDALTFNTSIVIAQEKTIEVLHSMTFGQVLTAWDGSISNSLTFNTSLKQSISLQVIANTILLGNNDILTNITVGNWADQCFFVETIGLEEAPEQSISERGDELQIVEEITRSLELTRAIANSVTFKVECQCYKVTPELLENFG